MKPVFYEKRSMDGAFAGSLCDHPFPAHVHDVVEVSCLTAGALEMTIGMERKQLRPGDIAIVFPNIPHSFDEVSPDAEGLALIFQPHTFAEFNQTFRSMSPVDPLVPVRAQPEALVKLIETLRSIPPHSPHPLRLGYMHLFLSYLFTCLPLEPLRKQTQSGLSSQALQYISEHFTEPLTLESTASALGISRIHLSHLFSQQLNINFRHYINMLRISHACSLLWNPSYSISQIAYLCGYGNPRTFHRAFVEQMHMQPSHYRLKHSVRPAPSSDAENETPGLDETPSPFDRI